MYAHLTQVLRAAGYVRVEISNWARPGHASRHNALYWTDRPYLGLGPGAHSYLPDGRRTANRADLARYLSGDDPVEEEEQPTPGQAATDLVVGGLRGRDGVDLARLTRRTGLRADPRALDKLVGHGLVARSGDRLWLTDEGVHVADAIAGHLADSWLVDETGTDPGSPGVSR
jgi:oxygen-independent coproporphyrinogen-3 oxidase